MAVGLTQDLTLMLSNIKHQMKKKKSSTAKKVSIFHCEEYMLCVTASLIVKNRPVARLFCGGGQIGQILGPFMITGGLSCDRVEFDHLGGGGGGGQMTPLTPPWLRA